MGKRKKVTTRDIAEALGVSQSTVSMILSEKPRVSFSQDTVDKVRAMAEQMGYAEQVPDASRKSKVLANTIIAICPNLSGGYYSMLLHSIIEQANQHKYTVLTVTTLRDARIEHIYLDLLARNQLAGIIVLYPMAQIPKLNELAGKVPVISIGDKPGSYHFDAVVLDSKKPAMMIAEHLLFTWSYTFCICHNSCTWSGSWPNPQTGRYQTMSGRTRTPGRSSGNSFYIKKGIRKISGRSGRISERL